MPDVMPVDWSRPQPIPLGRSGDRERPRPRIPPLLTSFVGRDREVAAVRALLGREDVRLVTLTGPGGVGKTRLALRVAEEPGDPSPGSELAPIDERGQAFPDGVVFVPLAPVADPDLVASTVAQALGVRDAGDRTLLERLTAELRERQMLLLLDNFEHLLPATPLVTDLLTACPHLKVLATSRTKLALSGEQAFAVPPLPLPSREIRVESRETSSRSLDSRLSTLDSDAVRLFVARAAAAKPNFSLSAETAPAIAGICRRLDGLPLAIELAAARVAVLPPRALLNRLEQRLALLTGGPRDLPDRLRTMTNAIAWSHDLLEPADRVLFRRLSVFAGGFTLEAAEAVCQGLGEPSTANPQPPAPSPSLVFDGVAALADKSLLQLDGDDRSDGDAEPRFRMLETVREYALERLAESGEADAVWAAHLAYYLSLVERAEATYLQGKESSWLAWLAPDQDNFRAALAWAIERQQAEAALRLAGAMVWLWWVLGQFGEGRAWLDRVLAPGWSRSVRASVRSKALYAAGCLAHYHGDEAGVGSLLNECEALSRAAGDRSTLARSLLLRGIAAEDAGDYGAAVPLVEEALALFRETGDRLWSAQALVHLGSAAFGRGDHGGARVHGEAALAALHDVGDQLGAAVGVVGALDVLSLVACAEDDYARAVELQQRALTMRVDLENRWGIAGSLAGLATIAARCGQPERATRLFGAAEALREAIGARLAYPERAAYEAAIATARARLAEPAFSAAWSAGRALSLDEAVAEGRALADEPVTLPAPAPGPAHGLSPRELEVLRLLVDGRSDREIGEALFISHRTAARHVANIYLKLDVSSRAAAVAFALRNGLA